MATQESRTARSAAPHRCLTCRERKIKCDGTRPICRNCQKARRQCQAAQGLELSWPKPRSRRALEGPKGSGSYLAPLRREARWRQNVGGGGSSSSSSSDSNSSSDKSRDYYFVNVLYDHVAAHRLLPHVSNSRGMRSVLFEREYEEYPYLSLLPRNPPSLYAELGKLQAGSPDLMSYFYHEASNSLPQVDAEPLRFRDLLLRMSLKDGSPSSKAVLYSLFCLSALRRYGNVQESAHFKDLALQSLQQATKAERIGKAEVMQHMAAGLMLCRAEINLGDDSNIFWALYVCSLRTLCDHAFRGMFSGEDKETGDGSILYPYIQYFDVLAQFSLSHWQRPSEIASQLSLKFRGQTLEFRCKTHADLLKYSPRDDYLRAEVSLLSRVLKASKQEQRLPDHPMGSDHLQSLRSLEYELETTFRKSKQRCLDMADAEDTAQLSPTEDGLALQRYLFLAATWIYFQRTCRHLAGPSHEIESIFDDAFSIIHRLGHLNVRIAPFSLFLLGAEANTESRRRLVLEAIHRQPGLFPTAAPKIVPHEDSPQTNVDCLLSAVWAQDDLHDNSEGYLDYVSKMHWVITARSVLPALV